MSRLSCWLIIGVGLGTSVSRLSADDAAVEEVRQAARAYVDAFNRGVAAEAAQHWQEHAVHTDRETGERTEGRAAIQADLEATFQSRPGLRLQFEPARIRLIQPQVAQLEAVVTLVAPDEEPRPVQVSAIFVRQGDKWVIDSAEEMNLAQPETSYDALKTLEWLVGDWQDESDDVVATSTFGWSPNGAFLVRSYSTQSGEDDVTQGTEVIGWDPRLQQIRSWSFHSDGSFGEGFWSQSGDEWLIKSTQTLADGGVASGTYVVQQVDDRSMTVRLMGHEVNGEPQPAREPVRVVRAASATSEVSPKEGAQ
jgi:uncharacterized protein (TIGR02246 family)